MIAKVYKITYNHQNNQTYRGAYLPVIFKKKQLQKRLEESAQDTFLHSFTYILSGNYTGAQAKITGSNFLQVV